MKRIVTLLVILVLLLAAGVSSGSLGVNWNSLSGLGQKKGTTPAFVQNENVKVIVEENVVTQVVEKVSPSVVTVSISGRSLGSSDVDPFDPFGVYRPRTAQKVEQDIGTGFIVSADGLIVTNKHVVSITSGTYKVITKDGKSYDAKKIYRDPTNDLAIIQIEAKGLTPVVLGNSDGLKVGQTAIAIGTALGEFRNTVTVGVISGLGRGITAGSPLEESVERLDNVIQTDAAINPGNSGGPLLNSGGQVIGINTAVSQEGQNIGFAIPINVVKEALSEFQRTGSFQRAFLGVRYKIITRDLALLEEVPEGAYIQEVVTSSPADQAGLKTGDIITKIDGQKISGSDSALSKIISNKKVGDKASIEIWRDGTVKTITVTLSEFSGE